MQTREHGPRLQPEPDRLESWKEIATYLNRSVRCVQLWERDAGLPVHRIAHEKRGSVFAYACELDAWRERYHAAPETNARPSSIKSAANRRRLVLVSLACSACLAVLIWGNTRTSPTRPDAEFQHVTPLTAHPGIEQAPSFSPDGSRIAFERRPAGASDSDICVQVIGAAEFINIAASPANEFGPAWSPKGSAIAYLRTSADTRLDLMLVAPTGGEPRKLTTITYRSTFELLLRPDLLTWAPDGRSIVFPDEGSDEYSSLWKIDIESGSRHRISAPEPRASHTMPRIHDDGRWLAYQQRGGQHSSQVFVAELDGNGMPQGSPVLVKKGLHTTPLGWLGNELLVLTRTNTTYTIERWSRSGGLQMVNIPNMTGPGVRLGSGALSRDGRRLVLTRSILNTDVWQLDLSPAGEGLNLRPLIESTFIDWAVDYARDGRRILFQSSRSGSYEAWIAAPDGSNLRRITDAGGLGYPRLSPDGGQIAFNRSEGGNSDVFVADVETGAFRPIVDHLAWDENPLWSRDGNWIYFSSDRSGRHEVWKVRRSGGDPVQITRNGGTRGFESPDGKYIYFGKEEPGGAHVWRMPVNGGPEERLFPSLVNWASLSPGSQHIYFVRGSPADPLGYGSTIWSYDFVSGRIRKVAAAGATVYTMAPSPDETRLIFGRGRAESDLMLCERNAK